MSGIGAAEGRIAGSDTREAVATPTVRIAATAAALASGPGWAAAFGMPVAWKRWVAMPAALAPWATVMLVAVGVAAAIVAWRIAPDPDPRRTPSGQERLPAGLGSAATLAFGAFLVAAMRDGVVLAMLLPIAPLLAGWIAGVSARAAKAACVEQVLSAASGVVVAGAITGLAFAGHLGLVARGSGFARAAGWTVAYALLSGIQLVRVSRSLPGDRVRIAFRAKPAGEVAGPEGAGMELRSIAVSFGSNSVLHGASLSVGPGELLALVGGNGAGKSTLMRTAAGFVAPDSGRVIVAGDDVTTLLPEERAAVGLAFVSGARPVFPDLSVIENLRVAAYRTHPTARSFATAVDSVLDLVPALAHRRKTRAGVLSGGEQRLLAVAQTLFRRPVVLLADELTLGLDLEARLAVLDLLRLLADQGVAVVVVDHDLPSLLPRADRATLLSHGDVRNYSDPVSLLDKRSDLLPATFLAGAAT